MLINAFKVPINLKSFILDSSSNLNPSFIEGVILTMTEINLNVYLNMTIFCWYLSYKVSTVFVLNINAVL